MLPVIIRRDGNVSNSMNLLINEEKFKKEKDNLESKKSKSFKMDTSFLKND